MAGYKYVIFIALIILASILLTIPKEQLSYVNILGIAGTIASVLGLVLTYLQILSIKETAVKTQKAVSDSITRVNEVLSISELSKGIKNIELIQNAIKTKEFGLAEILMKDLKGLLIQSKHIKEFTTKTETNEFQALLMNIGIDLNNLRQLDEGIEIDFYKIMSNLDEVSSTLIDLENKLKFKTYEPGAN